MGCLDAVLDWFKEHLLIVAAVAIAFIFPEASRQSLFVYVKMR